MNKFILVLFICFFSVCSFKSFAESRMTSEPVFTKPIIYYTKTEASIDYICSTPDYYCNGNEELFQPRLFDGEEYFYKVNVKILLTPIECPEEVTYCDGGGGPNDPPNEALDCEFSFSANITYYCPN